MLKNKKMVALLACFCCFLWGSAAPAIKIAYAQLQIAADDIPSLMLLVGARFSIGGVLVILACSLLQKRFLYPAKGSWGMVATIAVIQTVVQYPIYFIGMAHTAGVRGTIICASTAFWAILLASLVFRREKLTASKLGGCLVGFAGIVLINLGSDLLGPVTVLGEGFVLLSAAMIAVATILTKDYSLRENPMTLSGYQMLLGGTTLVIVSLSMGARFDPVSNWSWLSLAYLATIGAVAYTLWAVLLQNNPVSQVTGFKLTEPLFGVVLSAILLGEASKVNWPKCLVALVLVCAGIYIINRPQKEDRLRV